MIDEDRLRHALDYEIEPWTPDPAALMRGGRRMAWTRRGAVAAAALAVAGTVTGVAVAVNGVTAGQPPVSDRPSPSITKPTVPPSPTPSPACTYYRLPRPTSVRPAPPTREVRKPRCLPVVRKALVPPRADECLGIVVPRLTKLPAVPADRKCRILFVRPTSPVPTSVPAGK